MGIPHLAMAFELTTDYDERIRIFGYKSFIENLTTILATFSVPTALAFAGSSCFGHVLTRADCYRLAAISVSMMAIGAALIAYFGTTERPLSSHERQYGFRDGLKSTFVNKPFVILLVIFVMITIADRVTTAQLFILLDCFHGRKEEQTTSLLASFFAGCLLSVWPWVWCAQRFGKKGTFRIALVGWPLTCVLLVMDRWSEAILCLTTFSVGVCDTGLMVMLGALVPDVLEYDRLRTGLRREGIYVSVGNLFWQVAMGVGFLVAGLVLSSIGYLGGTVPSIKVVNGLRWSFGGIAIVLSLAALAVFSFFPITKDTHKAVVNAIDGKSKKSHAVCETIVE
jgi:glycoside/pentoside/hexuronide:cation symporter, GPH family